MEILLKQLVEIFIRTVLKEIRGKYEGYKVNFVFGDDAIRFFNYVKEYPYRREGYFIPDISDEDILALVDIDYNYPTIVVHDFIDFFDCLVKIVNANLRLLNIYGDKRDPEDHCVYILRRIWLRMGPEDFLNVERFLHNQLDMIQNELFDDYKFIKKIVDYCENEVFAQTCLNATWDETPRSMNFYIKKDKSIHDLPKVHFGIVGDTCYVYGIQNKKRRMIDKKIERTLYKLNKDKECLDIHPSAVYSMILFINLLLENNIKHIKVPLLQVLSYDYHIYLSEKEKMYFPIKWNKDKLERMSYLTGLKREYQESEYQRDLEWYNNIVDKEDVISKMKIDNLYNLFIRMQEHFPNLSINNEAGIEGDYIDITFKNNDLSLTKKPS